MLEDDIEYLGTNLVNPPPKLTFNTFAARTQPLAGLVLLVESDSNEDAPSLTFKRANATTIQIGRRPPSNDPAKRQRDAEAGKAMFKCPVVSRKHAKITFTDSGYAYIMDLGSHHGTHVRHKDESHSKMLTPQVATVLSDDDVVTFGKSVTKNEGIVRPVVARVKLLHTIDSPPPFLKPLIIPDEPSKAKQCGRFYVPSSGSSASDGSESDHGDSDIEEVPAPDPMPSHGPASIPSIGRVIDSFKSVVPLSPSQRLPPINLLRPIPVINFDEELKGTSSMDVSPSPNRSLLSTPAPTSPVDPLIVGAWPHSRSPSPAMPLGDADFEMDPKVNDFYRFAFDAEQPEEPTPEEENREETPIEEIPIDEPEGDERDESPGYISKRIEESESHLAKLVADIANGAAIQAAVDDAQNVPPPPPPPPPAGDEMKTTVNQLKTDVTKLDLHRRKIKMRFNSNMTTMNDRLSDMQDEVTDLHGQCTNLNDLVDGVLHWDVPDLQHQIDDLKSRVEGLENAGPSPFEAVQSTVDALNGLRENCEKEVQGHLKVLNTAKDEVLKAIGDALTRIEEGKKRKRVDDDEDEPASDLAPAPVDPSTTLIPSGEVEVPAPKRARTGKIARAAGMVAMGAVVTWGALAFT